MRKFAAVAKQADARDLKSLGQKIYKKYTK